MASPVIRDRITDFRRVKASDLLPNPRNWRTHPKGQQDALRGILAEVGYADALLARETPDGLMLIDGHLRAETTPDQDVPVLVLDVNEAEADLLLASLDPLAAMAGASQDKLAALLADVGTGSDALQAMLGKLAADVMGVPGEFGEALGLLPSGNKSPFQQMTFTLTDVQAETVKGALKAARGSAFVDTGNENSNGNALARICEAYDGVTPRASSCAPSRPLKGMPLFGAITTAARWSTTANSISACSTVGSLRAQCPLAHRSTNARRWAWYGIRPGTAFSN